MSTSYFKTKGRDTEKTVTNRGMSFLEGQVTKTHFVNDATNVSKKFVEYDVLARSSNGSSSTYKNCRYVQDISGFNDFEETVLEQNEVAIKGKLSKGNSSDNLNGTMVVIGFLDFNIDKPIIIGGFPHRRNTGATRADGIRRVREFRGIRWEINKDGEYIFTYKSPNTPAGEATRPDTAPTSFKVDTEGNFTFTQETSDGTIINTVKFDRTNEKKTEVIGRDNSIVEEKDGKAEKMTITFKSGLAVTIDGANDAVSIITNAGARALIDGANDTIELQDNGSGKLKITGETVAIGASSAELLQQVSDQLQELITLFNGVAPHTHIGNLGYPSAVPDTQALWVTAASNLSTIKGLVDGIKGVL